jgi:hypothetical protein
VGIEMDDSLPPMLEVSESWVDTEDVVTSPPTDKVGIRDVMVTDGTDVPPDRLDSIVRLGTTSVLPERTDVSLGKIVRGSETERDGVRYVDNDAVFCVLAVDVVAEEIPDAPSALEVPVGESDKVVVKLARSLVGDVTVMSTRLVDVPPPLSGSEV